MSLWLAGLLIAGTTYLLVGLATAGFINAMHDEAELVEAAKCAGHPPPPLWQVHLVAAIMGVALWPLFWFYYLRNRIWPRRDWND